jgi:hypothetical protein
MLLIVMVVYASYGLAWVFNRTNPQISKTTLMLSDDIFEADFRPQDLGFDFSFGLRTGSDIKYKTPDPSIAYFTARQTTYSGSANEVRHKSSRSLPVGPCGYEYFNYKDKEEITTFDIEDYNCIMTEDWAMKGNFYSNNFTYLTIKLNKCINGTNPAKVVC